MPFPGYVTDPFAHLVSLGARRPRRWGATPVRDTGYIQQPQPPTQPEPEAEHAPAMSDPSGVSRPDTPTPPAPPETDPSAPAPEAQKDASVDEQRLRGALRDLEATKRRVERDAQRVKEETRAQLVERLFPVLDSLDRAIAADSTGTALLQGVKQVRGQLEQTLTEYGLERIESTGERFDPALHEAVGVVRVPTESEDGMVMEQWEAGYRFGGRVLRAAKVTVGKLG